jgi:predicted small lipoprotein YifL
MKKVGKWFTALVVVGALAGCARTAPIENVRTTVGTGHTAEQVKSAIFKAGVQRQWIMNEAGPGLLKLASRTAITLQKFALTTLQQAIPSIMTAASICKPQTVKSTKTTIAG